MAIVIHTKNNITISVPHWIVSDDTVMHLATGDGKMLISIFNLVDLLYNDIELWCVYTYMCVCVCVCVCLSVCVCVCVALAFYDNQYLYLD